MDHPLLNADNAGRCQGIITNNLLQLVDYSNFRDFPMKKLFLFIFITAGFYNSSYAGIRYAMSYQCPRENVTWRWFTANNDMEASNEANSFLRNSSTKGCLLISLARD
jgi:hypothetical protein